MDSTRISLARALELGVQVSWREAAAIVHEAVTQTGPTKGTRPTRVDPDDCILTRGGEVALVGEAAKARPETMVLLLESLLPACDSPGGLGNAFEPGTVLAFLEELSQRTTAKRRRVEIASVAIRGIAAEADLSMRAADEESAGDQFAEFPPGLPADLTPPIPDPATPPPAAARATSFEPVAVPAATPPPSQIAPPPPPVDDPIAGSEDAFARLRDDLREEARRPGLDMARLVAMLRQLDWRKVAAVATPIVLLAGWYLWPGPALRLPDRPGQNDPLALTAVPLPSGWADLDRLGPRVRTRAAPVLAAAAPAAVTPPPPIEIRPSVVAEPRADAAVALVAPNAVPPTSIGAPVATAAPPPPPPAVTVAPPARAASGAGAADEPEVDADTVYSWSSSGVEPPVIRSPAMPSWATPAPGATIDGPYLEVLVDPRGQVETVRIRGRVDPGETFYRHRMMLASAKLWQFTPARLNGRPVRYVTRVVLEQP